jgi:hypothetical protein
LRNTARTAISFVNIRSEDGEQPSLQFPIYLRVGRWFYPQSVSCWQQHALVISGMTTYVNRRAPCPVDPVQAKSCQRARRWSAGVFGVSALLYAI